MRLPTEAACSLQCIAYWRNAPSTARWRGPLTGYLVERGGMTLSLATIRDLDIRGNSTLIRCEFNVPLNPDLTVADEVRIAEAAPTLRYAIDHGARVIIVSHQGRPWGKPRREESLEHIVQPLSRHLGTPVSFCLDCVGEERNRAVSSLRPGKVLLLQNVRYYIEENNNDEAFARKLAEGIEVYINDAFGNCHRPHASMIGVPRFVPARGIGFLVEKELKALHEIADNPRPPVVLIIGGAKVAGKDGKIHVIRSLLPKTSSVLIGGRIAMYFLAAKGQAPHSTLLDRSGVDGGMVKIREEVDSALQVLSEAEQLNVRVVLPIDVLVAESPTEEPTVTPVSEIPEGMQGLDIGPKTIEAFGQYIAQANTVIWNGPMGAFEHSAYAGGTLEIAKLIARSSATSLAGGGDSVKAISQAGVQNGFTHVSTGGGAMLAYLMGRRLPAIDALTTD